MTERSPLPPSNGTESQATCNKKAVCDYPKREKNGEKTFLQREIRFPRQLDCCCLWFVVEALMKNIGGGMQIIIFVAAEQLAVVRSRLGPAKWRFIPRECMFLFEIAAHLQ